MSTITAYSELSTFSCFLFQQAVEENNAGVERFNVGQYKAATKHLYASLGRMQHFSKIQKLIPREYYHYLAIIELQQVKQQQQQLLFRPYQYQEQSPRNSTVTTQCEDDVNDTMVDTSIPPRTSSSSSNYSYRNAHTLTPASQEQDPFNTGYATQEERNIKDQENDSMMTTVNVDDDDDATITNATIVSSSNSNNNIYRRAICISCHHGHSFEVLANPAYPCSKKDTIRIRASILYNLGLANHMLADTTATTIVDTSSATTLFAPQHSNGGLPAHVTISSSSPFTTFTTSNKNNAPRDNDNRTAVHALLEKATVIYKLSLSLQESEQAPISTDHVMALCNNLGQCYSNLNQESESKIWNERLLQLLVCEQQQQQQIHMHQDQQQQQQDSVIKIAKDCFVQNTMSLILTDPFISPAA